MSGPPAADSPVQAMELVHSFTAASSSSWRRHWRSGRWARVIETDDSTGKSLMYFPDTATCQWRWTHVFIGVHTRPREEGHTAAGRETRRRAGAGASSSRSDSNGSSMQTPADARYSHTSEGGLPLSDQQARDLQPEQPENGPPQEEFIIIGSEPALASDQQDRDQHLDWAENYFPPLPEFATIGGELVLTAPHPWYNLTPW